MDLPMLCQTDTMSFFNIISEYLDKRIARDVIPLDFGEVFDPLPHSKLMS